MYVHHGGALSGGGDALAVIDHARFANACRFLCKHIMGRKSIKKRVLGVTRLLGESNGPIVHTDLFTGRGSIPADTPLSDRRDGSVIASVRSGGTL
jgi:hypothetical protein